MSALVYFVCLCLLYVVFAKITTSSNSSRYNVLFVIVDDLRPALGCYQDKSAFTPHIDSLARRSVVFTNTFVQQALCAPSRNSLLTSRRPDTLHLYDFSSYWRHAAGNFTTLPQYLRDSGYKTVSVGKVFHPGASSNWSDDQPYSWSLPPYHPPSEQYKDAAVCPNKYGLHRRNLVCPVVVQLQPGHTLPDIETLQAAKSFLRKEHAHGQQEPFFLAVGFHKPHIPLKYPRHYLKFHPLESVNTPSYTQRPPSLPLVAWNPWMDVRKRDDIASLNLTFPFGLLPDGPAQLVRQSYYAAVTYIDDLFGQLMTELHETNHWNDTIVLLTGDHGWSLGEHGEWAKYSNYEAAVRVPLILHVPHLQQETPIYINALAETVDIFPTVAELVGLSSNLHLCHVNSSSQRLCTEGISLVPLIHQASIDKDKMPTWKMGAFSQYPRPGTFPSKNPNSDEPYSPDIRVMGYSLWTADHRYTEWVAFDPQTQTANWSHIHARELYDHRLDPKENLNLADRQVLKNLINRLSHQLRAGWRFSLPQVYNMFNDMTKSEASA